MGLDIKKIDLEPVINNVTNVGQKIFLSGMSILDIFNKTKLKVALISYYYHKPATSGVGIHVQNLAKYLAKNECDVHVFCSGEEEVVYKEDGVIVHVIEKIFNSVEDSFSKKRLEYDLFESDSVKAVIRENTKRRFDIIHTHGSLTKSAFILKKTYKIPWIHTFHAIETTRVKELSNEEKQFADLISWIESTVRHADGAIFVSNALLDECRHYYKIKSKKVISNGVDFETFRYSPITNKNVLFVGRFSKEKGIDLIPSIIPSVLSIPDATLTIVCPHKTLDGELKQIRDEIQKQKDIFKERLILVEDAQTQDKLVELYRNCQVYIQPSKYESFGLCIVEAMATGRPVVAFNVGGIPEVVGECGILAKNSKDFCSKLAALLNDPEKCTQLGKKASEKAKIYDWNSITQQVISYYTEVKNG